MYMVQRARDLSSGKSASRSVQWLIIKYRRRLLPAADRKQILRDRSLTDIKSSRESLNLAKIFANSSI